METHQLPKDKNYTKLANELLLRNNGLSPNAKLILIVAMALPPTHDPSFKYFKDLLNISKEGVRKAMRELTAKGYVDYKQVRQPNGTMKTEYVWFEDLSLNDRVPSTGYGLPPTADRLRFTDPGKATPATIIYNNVDTKRIYNNVGIGSSVEGSSLQYIGSEQADLASQGSLDTPTPPTPTTPAVADVEIPSKWHYDFSKPYAQPHVEEFGLIRDGDYTFYRKKYALCVYGGERGFNGYFCSNLHTTQGDELFTMLGTNSDPKQILHTLETLGWSDIVYTVEPAYTESERVYQPIKKEEPKPVEEPKQEQPQEEDHSVLGLIRQGYQEEHQDTFIPPTLDDVKAECRKHNYRVDPAKFYFYYGQRNWTLPQGSKMLNWRVTLEKWNMNENK